MKFHEKYLWLGAILIMSAVIHQQYAANNNLSFLLKTHELEDAIQDRQLSDLMNQIRVSDADGFNRGFDQGKLQASITLMNGDSLSNYADGYHAAISQFGYLDEPSPFDPATKPNTEDYLIDLLIDSMQNEVDTEEAYLEIIEMLVDLPDQELPNPSSLPPLPSITVTE